MYEHLFNYFGLRQNPFHVSPDPRFYFSTRAHDSALAELAFGVNTRQGFIVLTGEAGTGKTTLLNHLLNWLHERRQSTSYVFHSMLRPVELFEFILRDFGIPCESRDKAEILTVLHRWLIQRYSMGDSPVLILDEAQAIPARTLDQIRLLLNLEAPGGKLLQIILAGQPALEERLRRPELRQLHQRVMFRCHLSPLTLEEMGQYIQSRLAKGGAANTQLFPQESLEVLYMCSRGIPRVVNVLCEHALIAAYAADQKYVSPAMVQRVATDFDLTAHPIYSDDFATSPRFGRLDTIRPQAPVAQERADAPLVPPRVAETIAPAQRIREAPETSPASQAAYVAQVSPAIAASESGTLAERELASPSAVPEIQRTEAVAVTSEIEPPVAEPAPVPIAGPMPNFLMATAIAPEPAEPEPVAAAPVAASSLEPAEANAAAMPTPELVMPPADPVASAPEPLVPSESRGDARQTFPRSPSMMPRPQTVPVPPPRWIKREEKPVNWEGPSWQLRFMNYWRDVYSSFVRDWRNFIHANMPSRKASLSRARLVPHATSRLRNNVIVPIAKWLQQPTGASHRTGDKSQSNRPRPLSEKRG